MSSTAPRPALFAGLLDRPYLILTLTSAFWGGNMVAGKLAVGHVDAYTLTTLRWAGALLAILPFAIAPLQREWATIRNSLPLLLFYGAVGYCTFNILIYIAAHYTSGINIALEQVTINIFVMLANFILFRTRVAVLQLCGVALTIIGVALTATHGDLGRILALDINYGDGLVLLACVAYAAYSITLRWRPSLGWMSFLVVTFIGALAAAIFYQLTLGGGVETFTKAVADMSLRAWLIVAYVLLFPSILSQMFYARGVQLIGPNRASLFINLIPIFGTIGSVLVLGESLEGFHFVAIGLIVAGIVLAEWSARRAR